MIVGSLPRLYKKTNTGAIQYWLIYVSKKFNSGNGDCYLITTEYGQDGTNSPQSTTDAVYQGKNLGKKNATTAEQQALRDAKNKWTKQKKKGYVENIFDAENQKVDDLIEGGILPMLAFPYEKQGHKIVFPCYGQPKLDGHRCLCIIKKGKASLWSRTRKPIYSAPHIIEEIENKIKGWKNNTFILDGELYNHKYKENFEYISSLIRQEEPDSNHKEIQYHVYDLAGENPDVPFKSRYTALVSITREGGVDLTNSIKLVETVCIKDQDKMTDAFKYYRKKGYEGLMLRNSEGLYVNTRSPDLIKVKEFDDEEFKIVGIKEGKGKLRGHVGAFNCITKAGEPFDAKMSGDTKRLKEIFNDEKLWKNKLLTVQFQGYSKYGIPRFPVGLRISNDI